MQSTSEQQQRLSHLVNDWQEKLSLLGIADPLIDSGLAGLRDQVWLASDFVAQSCLRNPQMLLALINEGLLDKAYQKGGMVAALDSLLEGVADETELSQRLRQFRREQMVRIIWRDITHKAPLPETLEDLSELADISIQRALSYLYQWETDQKGVPRDTDGAAQQLVILGMGKLGARELNLSSDIDLIFAFPAIGQTDGPRAWSNEEFFLSLGRRVINALGKQTADGFVFRVDMRLRPFGESGPLAMSFDAMENYYQSQAREWERYAMIKARVVAGDEQAGKTLAAMLRPFIYRRYIDFGAIEAIRDMKQRIQREMHRKGMDANVKLGMGGIREIEFIGQAFQLVRGGRDPDLQVRPILEVLRRLQQKGLMPEYAVKELNQAYEFLRLTENRIQAWKDEQTHLLPVDDVGRSRLAGSMGFGNWDDFSAVLDKYRRKVHQHFQQVFAAPQIEGEEPAQTSLAAVWSGEDAPDLLQVMLSDAGFQQPEQALASIRQFQESAACRSLPSRGRQRLDQLMPLMLQAASQGGAPDRVLERLLRLLQAIVRRTSYLDMLVENPLALSQLVKLSGESSWVISQLIRQPIVLDELLDSRTLYTPLRRDDLERELDILLGQVASDDLEQQMERLRQFADGNRMRVAAADIAGVIPLRVVSDYLTEIAEVVLSRVMQLAWQQLVDKHGYPQDIEGEDSGFVVIAYGKLGGIELGYSSDLDMVFVHGSQKPTAVTTGKKSVANDVFYARLGQRIIHILTTRMPSGILYEADMRLRPNGNAGMLATSLTAFEKYQMEQAWTWEHQALIRARPIAGDPEVMAHFEAIRRRVLGQPRDPDALRKDVVEMREKMRVSLDAGKEGLFDLKQGVGGIADIEFMVQYAVLRWASEYPQLLDWTDNIRLLETLGQVEVLEGASAQLLSNAYQVFRAVMHRNALQEEPGLMPDTELREERKMVQDIWQQMLGS